MEAVNEKVCKYGLAGHVLMVGGSHSGAEEVVLFHVVLVADARGAMQVLRLSFQDFAVISRVHSEIVKDSDE